MADAARNKPVDSLHAVRSADRPPTVRRVGRRSDHHRGGHEDRGLPHQNTVTHNAAIVEIKRPKTPLFSREYRGGVYPPSWHLIGAVTEVLDQRLKLVTGIMATLYNSRELELAVSAVECVVVAGLTPTEKDRISSLELVRNQLKDVRIVTFDEMLDRLQLLRELLSGERYVSLDEDDWEGPTLPESDEGR